MLRAPALTVLTALLTASPLAAQSSPDRPPVLVPERPARTSASPRSLPDAVAALPAAETRISAGDADAGDVFGRAVAIDGARAVVGAWADDDLGSDSGSAYVFGFDGTAWVQHAKLNAPDGAADDYFAFTVALSDNRAIISAIGDDENGSNSGSAYVYVYDGTTWTEEGKLVPDDGAENDLFGVSVAIDGDRALVGAYADRDEGPFTGSAYVFEFDGSAWTQQAKLTASDATRDSRFGFSAAIDGDYALIGADVDDASGTNAGAAYVFAFDGSAWTQQAKLTAADTVTEDYFGESVSLDGDRALIGAWYNTELGFDAGAAYVFERDGASWTETAKLLAADGQSPDQFGGSVSLDGDRALIGARFHSGAAFEAGAAYLFSFDGTSWAQQAKLVASDASAEDSFGRVVSLSGDVALVGAPLDDDAGTSSGSAYLFSEISTASAASPRLLRPTLATHPNPAAGQATVTVTLAEPGPARLSLHDVLGRELAVLTNAPRAAGDHPVELDTARLAPGVYIVRLRTESGADSTRLTIVR